MWKILPRPIRGIKYSDHDCICSYGVEAHVEGAIEPCGRDWSCDRSARAGR
jgi:hypothetical protein